MGVKLLFDEMVEEFGAGFFEFTHDLDQTNGGGAGVALAVFPFLPLAELDSAGAGHDGLG